MIGGMIGGIISDKTEMIIGVIFVVISIIMLIVFSILLIMNKNKTYIIMDIVSGILLIIGIGLIVHNK